VASISIFCASLSAPHLFLAPKVLDGHHCRLPSSDVVENDRAAS